MRNRRAIALLFLLLPLAASAATGDGSSGSGDTATSQLYAALFQGCWACGAFNTLGAIGLSFADTAFSQLASGMTILIGLFMALWVLYFAAKLFLPFGAPGSAHWNMGATKLLQLIFVLAFLQTSGPFWNYIFTPILSTGLGLASQLATAADKYETNFGQSSGVPGGFDYCAAGATPPDTQVSDLSDAAKQGLVALEQMDCPLSRMQSAFGKGIIIGVTTINQMGCEKRGTYDFLPTLSDAVYAMSGIILIAVFLFGFLVFPFLLIDVLARVTLVAAISPVAIAAILFKQTHRIAERSVWSLLQAGITLMFGAAIAGIGKALIAYIFNQMATSTGISLTSWNGVQATLENACSNGFHVNLLTGSFYMLVGTGIITIYMMRRASSLAAELTGISGATGAQAGLASLAGGAGWAAGKLAKEHFRGNDGGGGRGPGPAPSDVTGTTKK